jgi:adenylate kinase
MRIVMIGPPGAGKGTQGALIAAHFDIPRIVMGDLLRDHVARRTDLGRAVRSHLDRGELVPDEITLCIVRQALIAAREAGGAYVSDGAPRTMAQARAAYKIAMELGMSAHVAVHLRVGDTELIRRLLARAALEHRPDDTEQVIGHRLELYHQVTRPVIAWYSRRGILVSVDAMRPVEEVGREILAALELKRPPTHHITARVRRPVDLTRLGAQCGQVSGLWRTGRRSSHRRRDGEPQPAGRTTWPRYASLVSRASIPGTRQAWTRRLLRCGVAAGPVFVVVACSRVRCGTATGRCATRSVLGRSDRAARSRPETSRWQGRCSWPEPQALRVLVMPWPAAEQHRP